MRKSLWIVLAILAALASPQVSYAQEIDYLQSFGNGLQTLTGETKNEKVTPESDYQEGYEPVVREVQSEPADNEPVDLLTQIKRVPSALKVPWTFGQYSVERFYSNIWILFCNTSFNAWFLVSIGLVFMWWGVRKAKSIIWTAFRTGRLNLGTSVKRAWYRRKAKEWYG